MIKNDKQFSTTEGKIVEFKEAIVEFKNSKDLNKALNKLQLKGLEGQLISLEDEVGQYKSLKDGNLCICDSIPLEKVNEILIKARIAKKISQAELAEKAGMVQQQIQRYESTNYEAANLSTVVNIAYALGLRLAFEKVILFYPKFELPENITEEKINQRAQHIKERGLFSL